MPNGELFICMFCSDRNSRKGFAAFARLTDQFKELQTLCFDILRGTGLIENEQTIDILGSEAKAEHASPQRREARTKRQWMGAWCTSMKKMRSRQLLNIKLIEQLIKTPSSWRSSNT